MAEVLAKGVNFVYAKRFIEQEYGAEAWQKILNSLPQEAKNLWAQGTMVSSSYPFSAFKEMTYALSLSLGVRKDSELARIYEYIADQSLNKVYKLFFSLTNPSFVIKNYPKLWAMFFNSGTVEVETPGKGFAVLKFNLPEIFLDWITPACLGYSKKAVEMAGGRNLTMKTVKKDLVSRDTREIVFELKWN